jgi:hypothetical protein
MASVPHWLPTPPRQNGYPSGDGKPFAETDRHREVMSDLIHELQQHFARRQRVYDSGDLRKARPGPEPNGPHPCLISCEATPEWTAVHQGLLPS